MEIKTADLKNLDTSGFVVYDNGNLAFFDQAHDSNIDTRKVVLPEIFITVLTLRGEASVRVNDVDYTLREHDLLICQPNDLLENLTRSADYECHCVCVSPAYMRQIVPLAENAWAIKFLFKERPVYALNEREAAVFCQYYDQMRSKGYLPAAVLNYLLLLGWAPEGEQEIFNLDRSEIASFSRLYHCTTINTLRDYLEERA